MTLLGLASWALGRQQGMASKVLETQMGMASWAREKQPGLAFETQARQLGKGPKAQERHSEQEIQVIRLAVAPMFLGSVNASGLWD